MLCLASAKHNKWPCHLRQKKNLRFFFIFYIIFTNNDCIDRKLVTSLVNHVTIFLQDSGKIERLNKQTNKKKVHNLRSNSGLKHIFMECFKKHQYVSVLSLPFNLLNFVPKVDKQNNNEQIKKNLTKF